MTDISDIEKLIEEKAEALAKEKVRPMMKEIFLEIASAIEGGHTVSFKNGDIKHWGPVKTTPAEALAKTVKAKKEKRAYTKKHQMVTPPAKLCLELNAYIRFNGLTNDTMARKIGVSKFRITCYRRGKKMPAKTEKRISTFVRKNKLPAEIKKANPGLYRKRAQRSPQINITLVDAKSLENYLASTGMTKQEFVDQADPTGETLTVQDLYKFMVIRRVGSNKAEVIKDNLRNNNVTFKGMV